MKLKLIISCMIMFLGMHSFAETIPDPTVQIMTPPAGLPGASLNSNTVLPAPVYNEFNIQGVFIAQNQKKEDNNKVFMNNGFYRVGDIVSDMWKVKSITRKRLVLVNIQTRQVKNLNISGE